MPDHCLSIVLCLYVCGTRTGQKSYWYNIRNSTEGQHGLVRYSYQYRLGSVRIQTRTSTNPNQYRLEAVRFKPADQYRLKVRISTTSFNYSYGIGLNINFDYSVASPSAECILTSIYCLKYCLVIYTVYSILAYCHYPSEY